MSTMRIAICLICLTCFALAQDNPPIISSEQQARELADGLKSENAVQVKKAVGEIETLYESDPGSATGFLRKYWLDALVAKHRFDTADQIAWHGILEAPWRTGDVAYLQEVRVQMQLRMGNAKQALSQCRSLFNVTPLPETGRVLLLTVECMKTARGEDPKMLREFAHEQIQGAATRPYDQPNPVCPMMAQIPIDPAPYESTIKQLTSDDDQTQLGKGNLLLLSGRSDEARVLFEQRLRASTDSDRTWLIQDVARAIRALDGNIGRANEYVLTQAEPTAPGSGL